jgi:hypothetical protein
MLLGTALLGTAGRGVTARKEQQRRNKSRRKHARSQVTDAVASGQNSNVPHCISPFGLDLNAFYGVTEQVAATFCPPGHAGRPWRPASRWETAPNFDAYDELPDGFEPVSAIPQEDFIAKFQAVTYVIDPGTRQEKTVVFPKSASLFTQQLDDFDVTSPITLGVVKPLSVGDHAVDISWQLSAMHCDGFGTEMDVNCLAAGDFFYGRWQFTVMPGHS